jgi:hypothetical protein
MKLPRRQFLHLSAGAAALPSLSRVAWAQAMTMQSANKHGLVNNVWAQLMLLTVVALILFVLASRYVW